MGGLLYGRFGYRAPFIFGIVLTVVDLVFRWLFIERKDALKLGFDPSVAMKIGDIDAEATERTTLLSPSDRSESPVTAGAGAEATSAACSVEASKTLSLPQVIFRLSKSPRALAALLITVADGQVLYNTTLTHKCSTRSQVSYGLRKSLLCRYTYTLFGA